MSNSLDITSAQLGLAAFVRSDIDWEVETIHPLELITEAQATIDLVDTLVQVLCVIKKMTAAEAVEKKITNPKKISALESSTALRWALEAAKNNRGLIDHRKYASLLSPEDGEMQAENFSVRSFYEDKNLRMTNIHSYYGNFYVVEFTYTRNTSSGKVNKEIFFPSVLFQNISQLKRDLRVQKPAPKEPEDLIEDRDKTDGAGILSLRDDVYDRMSEAVTVIVFDRE